MVGLLVLLTYRAYAALSRRHTTLSEVNAFAQRVVGASGGGELVSLLLRDVDPAARRRQRGAVAARSAAGRPRAAAAVTNDESGEAGEPVPVEGERPDLAVRADAGTFRTRSRAAATIRCWRSEGSSRRRARAASRR